MVTRSWTPCLLRVTGIGRLLLQGARHREREEPRVGTAAAPIFPAHRFGTVNAPRVFCNHLHTSERHSVELLSLVLEERARFTCIKPKTWVQFTLRVASHCCGQSQTSPRTASTLGAAYLLYGSQQWHVDRTERRGPCSCIALICASGLARLQLSSSRFQGGRKWRNNRSPGCSHRQG